MDGQIERESFTVTEFDMSLLTELDRLEVIEADELQEGVAFHAFRFSL